VTTVYVADLSNNNADPIDFGAMAAGGVAGVILKASEGTNFIDLTFSPRARAAAGHGLAVGGYHFFHPAQDPAAQARLFESVVGASVSFRTADVEVAEGPAPEGAAKTFIGDAAVRLLYSGAWFAGHYLAESIPGVEWWLAAYGQQQPTAPWGRQAGWQFTQAAHVPGVPGPCDLSIFDLACWADLTGQTPNPTEAPLFDFIPSGPDAGWYVFRSDGHVETFNAPYFGGGNTVAGGMVGSILHTVPWTDEHGAAGFEIRTHAADGVHGYRFSPNHPNGR
jgi:lysozyme